MASAMAGGPALGSAPWPITLQWGEEGREVRGAPRSPSPPLDRDEVQPAGFRPGDGNRPAQHSDVEFYEAEYPQPSCPPVLTAVGRWKRP